MALIHRPHLPDTLAPWAPSAGTAAESQSRRSRSWRDAVWSVPVGLQLSLVYALLVTVTLALLGWALYTQLEGFLVQNAAERLNRFTSPILVRSFPGRGQDGVGDPGMRGSSLEQAGDTLVRQLSGPDIGVVVLDGQGQVINATGSPFRESPVQAPAMPAEWAAKLKSASLAQPVQWVASVPGSERQLVVLTPLALHTSDGSPDTPLYLEQITSLGAADAVLNQLKLYILLGIILGTAIGMTAGLALTRTILRPLDRMVRTAEAISEGELDRRLHLPAGRNEVARLSSAFDHMVDRLAAALEAQKRFVADASHELRTPLTSLEGLSEMLMMGADRGDARVVQRMVRSMHSELGRLGRLVADLLTLSRLDSASLPGQSEQVPADVGTVLREVYEQMGPAAAGRGISLAEEYAGPVVVRGEPDKLKQVLLNLVDNAFRYTPEGGSVQLSAAYNSTSGQAQIRVRDTGAGIPPEDLPHIFDRFYRGDLSRARATGNSGLGLAIVRGIVEAQGGTIEVQSAPGHGTCFTITLPALHPDAYPAALAPEGTNTPHPSPAPSLHR